MITKYDFPEVFRTKLYLKASALVKKETTGLEKDMLEQHLLLSDLTDVPWRSKLTTKKIGIFIGAAEGFDNVHEAYFLGKAITNKFSQIKIKYITSGAIGITKGKSEELGVPGVNAKVMSQLLYEYGISEKEVITENKSLHTDMQAVEMQKIIEKERFNSIICATDYWHGARLMMTMIGRNPDTLWFSHYVESDKDNIGSALFDWGQKLFQAPLLIAEVARLHNYIEKNMGPCDLDELCNYLIEYHPNKLKKFIKLKKLSRLKFLWEKTHTEILKEFEKFSSYR